MTSYEIKCAACSVYCESQCLSAMYSVVVVYDSYTRVYTRAYNCHTQWARCIHGYKLFDVIVQLSHLTLKPNCGLLNCMLEALAFFYSVTCEMYINNLACMCDVHIHRQAFVGHIILL